MAFLVPGYQLLERIRTSAFAEVYRAVALGRPGLVAVKVGAPVRRVGGVGLRELAPALWAPRAVTDLRAHEALVLGRMAGQGAPRLLDHGVHEGRAFVVTEWIEGDDADRFGVTTARRWQELEDIGVALAEILARAAARGIVHRDVKPSNLKVWRQADGKLGVALLDWELAQLDGRRAHGQVGTAAYRSPEVVGLGVAPGRAVDARADLYSLGATLYTLVTGTPPFPARETSPAQHVLATPRPLALACPEAPARLAAVVDRLLAKLPEQRLPDGAAVVAALRGGALAPAPASELPEAERTVAAAERALERGELVGAVRRLETLGAQPEPDALALWVRFWLAVEGWDAAAALLQRLPADDAARPRLEAQLLHQLGQAGPALERAQAALTRLPGDARALGELARCQRATGALLEAERTCLALARADASAGAEAMAEQVDFVLARFSAEPAHQAELARPLASASRALAGLSTERGPAVAQPLLELAAAVEARPAGARGVTRPGVGPALMAVLGAAAPLARQLEQLFELAVEASQLGAVTVDPLADRLAAALEVADGQHGLVVGLAEALVRLDPGTVRWRQLLQRALQQAGLHGRALAWAEDAVTHAPEQREALMLYVDAALRAGHPGALADSARRVGGLASDHPALGWVLAHVGRQAGTLEDLVELPRDPALAQEVGEVVKLLEAGHLQEASLRWDDLEVRLVRRAPTS